MKGADILRFILSLAVVWIHTGTSALSDFTRWAVPIFFLLSGFFLFGKVLSDRKSSPQAVSTWFIKTLRLYLLWTVIFIPYAVIGFRIEGMPVAKAAAVWLRNVLFIGENYLSWQLWYLLGLLYAGIIIWIVEKLKLPLWVYPVLALGLALLPHFVPFEDIHAYAALFKTTRNGIFVGFPYMVLGGALRYFFPGIKGWEKESRWYRPAINLRYLSVHIYLTHMIWAGCFFLLAGWNRGITLWAVTCAISILTGLTLMPCTGVRKFLYGR